MSAARMPNLLVPSVALAVGLVAGWLARSALLPKTDVDAETAALIQTDREFAQMSRESGQAAAFYHFLAEDALTLRATGDPAIGRGSADHPQDGTTLTWEPKTAAVARSGDLGYTWGTYELTVPVAAGPPKVTQGKYANVWRKDPQGRWRVVLDIGNSPPPKP